MREDTKFLSPSDHLDHGYDSYENTRETTRLRTEYERQTAATTFEKGDGNVNPGSDRLIFVIRLILRIMSLLVVSSIAAILAYSVWLYRSTKDDDVEIPGDHVGFQSVWVTGLKMAPTYVLLGVSCAATLLDLVILIANFSRAIRYITNVSNIVTAIVSVIGCVLWAGVGIWYKSDDWNKAMNMDITSYVCRQRDNQSLQTALGNMGLLCGALRYAWWAVILVISIELFSMVTVGWGAMVAKQRGLYARLLG